MHTIAKLMRRLLPVALTILLTVCLAYTPRIMEAASTPVITIVNPLDGAQLLDPAEARFEAVAHSPDAGTANGAGISAVVFELVGADYAARERFKAYCAFGGDDSCNPMPQELFDRLAGGSVVLRARAIAKGGATSPWVSHSFTIAAAAEPTATPEPPSPTPDPLPATATPDPLLATATPEPPSPTATATPPPAEPALLATQWQPLTLELEAQRDYGEKAAYTTVIVTAQFVQGERTMTVAGFWDGGRSWRLRWTPPTAGDWQYTITSNQDDPGLSRSGLIQAAPATGRGFLRVDPQHEAFGFDSGERPTLLGTTVYEVVKQARAGDTSWHEAFAQYRAHGIGKVRLLVYPWPTNPSRPTGYPDSAPFVDNDHDRLDLDHWRALDQVIARAEAEQLVVDLIIFANNARCFGTVAQDERYLRYVLARYAASPAVSWSLTNEWDLTGKDKAYWNALGAIVRAEDPWMAEGGLLRALSIHQSRGVAFAFADAAWPTHAVIQYNQRHGYSFGDQWGSASILPNSGRGLPVVNEELGYYGQNHNGVKVTRDQVRRALWGIVASGGYGTTGDASTVAGGLVYKSGRWHDLGAVYDDIRLLHDALSATPRWWEYTAQQGVIRGGQRVYAAGAPGVGYLVYAANGGQVALALAAGSYELTELNPRTGERKSLGASTQAVRWSPPVGADWALLATRVE